MRFLLLDFSTPVLVLMIVGGAVCLTVAATFIVRRLVPEAIHAANNQVAGFMFSALCVIYGVLLAFTAFVVWQQFQDAQTSVTREANATVDLFRFAQGLPAHFAAELENADSNYVQSIVNDEWNTMQDGQSSPQTTNALQVIWQVHRRLDLENLNSEPNEDKFFSAVNTLENLRLIRLLASSDEIPMLMWVLLWGGALVTVGFSLFFRVHNAGAHLLMAALLSGSLSFVLLLIIELDSPFTGTLHVMSLAFQQALETMQRLH